MCSEGTDLTILNNGHSAALREQGPWCLLSLVALIVVCAGEARTTPTSGRSR
jgi:hypothetical protein